MFGKENAVVDKSKKFALRIIKLYQYLTETKNEYVMSKQILRCGTSVGANIREAIRAQSKPDFYTKLYISLKEAEESLYWLELLYEAEYIEKSHFDSIYTDAEEIVKILVAITKNQGKFIS